MRKTSIVFAIFFITYLSFSCSKDRLEQEIVSLDPYPDEVRALIGRGLVALPKDQNQIFLSWRLLPNDPESVSFNVYRKEVGRKDKRFVLIAQTNRTYYIDYDVQEKKRYAYTIRPIHDGKEGESSGEAEVTATVKGKSALVFNIGQDYKYARVATGDLNGDGEMEVVVAYANSRNVDSNKKTWQKSEDTIKVTAFLHTGERLWTIDLGWGIEAGGVYSPMVIWDIDADGRAEVLLKTNRSPDPLDYNSERLTILDGETGKMKGEAKWPRVKAHFTDYNNNSRNYLAIAHLDGKNPYIIVGRGLYKTQVIWAYDSNLNKVWERAISYSPVSNKYLIKIWRHLARDRDRGSHSLPIADINEDGKEEILWGEHCIGENGKDLWVIEDHMPYEGHPDVVFTADILPSNKGKEVFYGREGWYHRKNEKIGVFLADNKGKTIWAHWGYTHIDGGWVAKILPHTKDMQSFAFDIPGKKLSPGNIEYYETFPVLWSSDGKFIANPPNSWVMSFPVDWDGDGVREICTQKGEIQKFNGTILAKLGPGILWGADLFGDHREELVVAPQDQKVYIFFNTEAIETPPRITPIIDRQYKNDLSRTAMQFNVVPTEGGYIPKRLKTPLISGK